MSEQASLPMQVKPLDGKEVWVHCAKCRHEWIAAHLPMPIDRFVRLAKRATCPNCGAVANSVMAGKRPAEQVREGA